MGLFTNNKKLCPICGSPTPRLLASAVEGQNLCKECAAKIDLPDGVLNSMTLDEFREYINCYDANKPLRDSFTETYRYDFGFFKGRLVLDMNHQLLRLGVVDTAFALEPSDIKSFRILEDGEVLYEGEKGNFRSCKSNIKERLNELKPRIDEYRMLRHQYEMMEEMRRSMDENNRRNRVIEFDKKNKQWHVHQGYLHSENSENQHDPLSISDVRLLEKVKKIWHNHREQI